MTTDEEFRRQTEAVLAPLNAAVKRWTTAEGILTEIKSNQKSQGREIKEIKTDVKELRGDVETIKGDMKTLPLQRQLDIQAAVKEHEQTEHKPEDASGVVDVFAQRQQHAREGGERRSFGGRSLSRFLQTWGMYVLFGLAAIGLLANRCATNGEKSVPEAIQEMQRDWTKTQRLFEQLAEQPAAQIDPATFAPPTSEQAKPE